MKEKFFLICGILGNVCFSRRLYDEVGGYDESVGMAEDLDLYVRFLIHGHLNVYLPMISHLHRMHTANFSIGCDRDHHHADLTDIYRRNEEKLKAQGVKLTLSN
jgi:GT2 family glycosyltransferase